MSAILSLTGIDRTEHGEANSAETDPDQKSPLVQQRPYML